MKIGDDWSIVALELLSPSGHGGRRGVLNLGPGSLSPVFPASTWAHLPPSPWMGCGGWGEGYP